MADSSHVASLAPEPFDTPAGRPATAEFGRSDIIAQDVRGFVRSEGGGVVVLREDDREPEWIVPGGQWDEFCRDALSAINRRERERRDAGA